MATRRHKPEGIVTKLRQVEVLVGEGMARVDAIREVRNEPLSAIGPRDNGARLRPLPDR